MLFVSFFFFPYLHDMYALPSVAAVCSIPYYILSFGPILSPIYLTIYLCFLSLSPYLRFLFSWRLLFFCLSFFLSFPSPPLVVRVCGGPSRTMKTSSNFQRRHVFSEDFRRIFLSSSSLPLASVHHNNTDFSFFLFDLRTGPYRPSCVR